VIYTDNDRDPLGGQEDEWGLSPNFGKLIEPAGDEYP
jgi:hypothetical protein